MQKHYYDLRYQVDETEWRARAKRALVFQLWNKFKKTTGKHTILDYGCGTGVQQVEFEKRFKNIETFGIDISEQTVKYCKSRGIKNVSVFDGKKIPFQDNKFDLVTAIDVLEHVKDDSFTINEIKRVLKPGGLGIFLVPAHQNLWSTRDVRLKHCRRYEKGELVKKVKDAKFKLLASKNVDFALYFVLLAMCKLAKKKNGVTDLSMETAKTNSFLNEVMYFYEMMENKFQSISTFPIGISNVVVVKK